jgi:hypothetical protein
LPFFHPEGGGTLSDVSLAIFDGFLFRIIRNYRTPVPNPKNIGVGGGGGASVAGAGASGHEKPSVPPWGRTLLALHLYFGMTGWIFLNNLGIIPK